MYCTLEGRDKELQQTKKILGGGDPEREALIESAADLFTQQRMRHNESPRRVKMYPDEYPFTVGADSSEYLTKQLGLEKIEDSFISSKDNLIKLLQTEDPKEATIKLNDVYRDKLFKVEKCGDSFVIQVENKPTTKFKERTEIEEGLKSPKSILNLIDRLVEYHGIDINLISNRELALEQWKNIVNAQNVKGFIKDGKIYLNTDNVTIDTKVHELMHLFLGSIRFVDPQLYFDTIQSIAQDPIVEIRAKEFVNKSDSDLLEEVFVDEYSKYLTGQKSIIDNLSEDILYDLNYNIHRLLDTMFMGDYSSKIIPDRVLPLMTMFQLGQALNSKYIYPSIFMGAKLHRQYQNLKEQWIKSGKIIKEC